MDASGLSAGAWYERGEAALRRLTGGRTLAPEELVDLGREHAAAGDDETALFAFGQAIREISTAYGFRQMQHRRPSDADLPAIDGFLDALGRVMQTEPEAPVDEAVRQATYFLRGPLVDCQKAGLDDGIYRHALTRLALMTPRVKTSDLFWRI